MDTNEFEYYVIERSGNKAYPLIKTHDDSDITREYMEKKAYIENPELMAFAFKKPYPRKAVIGDYFALRGVVSQKIADVLLPMNIKGIQLISATVTSNKGELYEGFYYINIYHVIEAMDRDKEKSKYDLDEYGVSWIDRFSLDKEVLKQIPLEERLIFLLKEHCGIKLYHRSVVDAIMAVNPEGVRFVKVEDWSF